MRIKSTLLAVAAGALIGCGFVLVKKHHDHSPFSEQEQRLVWDALTCSGKLVFDCDGETTTLGACASRMVWHVHVTPAALCLPTRWGRVFVTSGFSLFGNVKAVDVDVGGVKNVNERGWWWRVIRRDMKPFLDAKKQQDRRIAWQKKRDKFVCDSIRRFKIDSTMRAVGEL